MDEPLLIAGGGPAGAAAALTLLEAGLKPLLVDREGEAKEKVCGCFLSVEAVAMLERLGLDVDRLGASRIGRVRVTCGKRSVEAALPFLARGLSRRVLDGALIDKARDAGAEIRRETVAALNGNIATLRGGTEIRARALFLGTGKHDVRGGERPVIGAPGNIGLKQMFRLSPAQKAELGDAVELYLFDGGYAGLQLVENGFANLCMVIGCQSFEDRGGMWEALLDGLAQEMPLLDQRLADAEALGEKPLAIAHIPYGFVFHPDARAGSLSYRIGDQAAVIPSFSGDGMAIALHTGMSAARCHLAGGSAADFHLALGRRLKPQFRRARGLDRLAQSGLGRGAIMVLGGTSPALLRWAANSTRLAGAVS